MESMDKLSFELLTNRRQYHKYLGKIDPKKFEENEELRQKMVIYKDCILRLVKDYLYDNASTFDQEIDELLPILMRKCIRYFEMKEQEKPEKNGWQMDGPDIEDVEEEDEEDEGEREEEEETLFSNNEVKPHETREEEFMKSYWGKSFIKKL
jgi:hypothetical protein